MSDVFRTDGGIGQATAPPEFADYILDRLRHHSVLLAAGARYVPVSGKSLTIPRLTADTPMSWHAEGDDMTGTAGDADTITLAPTKVGTVLTVTRESVNDSDPASLAVLGDNMAASLALAVDKGLFAGTGSSNQPRGFVRGTVLNAANTAIQVYGDSAVVEYASIVGARTLAKATGGRPSVLFVNPAAEGTLAAATDGLDRPLLTGTADDSAEVIAGQRVFVTPALTGVTGNDLASKALTGLWGVVCDPAQIVVGIRSNLDFAVSQDAAFATDSVAVRISARVAVDLNDPSGICLIGPDTAP